MTQHVDQQYDMNENPQSDDASQSPSPNPPLPGRNAQDVQEERDLWTGRTHWRHFLGLLLLLVAWTVIGCVIGFRYGGWVGWTMLYATLLAWALAWGRVGFGVLFYRYRLTTQRLFIERGILGKTIDQTELIRVDDVRVRKTLMNRMMKLGSIEVVSTDPSDGKILITGIPHPEQIADQIREHMKHLRRRSLFVESL